MKNLIMAFLLSFSMSVFAAPTEQMPKVLMKSSCLACHAMDKKLVGPSFIQIAEKYQKDKVEMTPALTTKLIKGGKNVWGAMTMPPMPKLKHADAEAMVDAILNLR